MRFLTKDERRLIWRILTARCSCWGSTRLRQGGNEQPPASCKAGGEEETEAATEAGVEAEAEVRVRVGRTPTPARLIPDRRWLAWMAKSLNGFVATVATG
jgi:hypothetical protein